MCIYILYIVSVKILFSSFMYTNTNISIPVSISQRRIMNGHIVENDKPYMVSIKIELLVTWVDILSFMIFSFED